MDLEDLMDLADHMDLVDLMDLADLICHHRECLDLKDQNQKERMKDLNHLKDPMDHLDLMVQCPTDQCLMVL